MKLGWFDDSGILPRPASLGGWLVVLAGVAIIAGWFLYTDARSHSVSDTLEGTAPIALLVLIGVRLVASITTGGDDFDDAGDEGSDDGGDADGDGGGGE